MFSVSVMLVASKTNMLMCMKVCHVFGLDGLLRPNHLPAMEGDKNDDPAYSSIGQVFATGYIKGLRQAVYAGDPIFSWLSKSRSSLPSSVYSIV